MRTVGETKSKVLLIVGNTRSGSTLLDRLLGRLPGCFSTGEFYWVWHHCFLKNQACACGQPFDQCEFWGRVVTEAFGGFDRVDAERIVRLQRAVEGRRYSPPLRSTDAGTQFEEYKRVLGKLYEAVCKVSRCEVIVDSSKFPARGFLLQAMPGIELSIVHIVRDSRAVAYSWQRKKVRPEIHWKEVLMARKSALHCAITWNASNGLAHVLARGGTRYTLLRYEDLARDPRGELTRLATQLGLGGELALEFLDGQRADLGDNHTVAGNPMRFACGHVEIRADTEWQECMRRRDRALVSVLTFPLLLRYGYLGSQS